MADPKYADLPGIALDEPDVYESNDLPESEQVADFYEQETNVVERIHITADEAFNKFKGKYLNQQNVDFSDKISSSIRTGYDARSGDWELVTRGEKETPLQKYQRLQCELKELLEEVEDLKPKQKEMVDCVVTSEQVQQALIKLGDIKLEEALGEDLVSSISDSRGTLIKQFMSQLEQFKTRTADKPESENVLGSGITYQFSYRPEQAKLVQTSRIAELESRIHQLESILGHSDEKLTRLASGTKKASLVETAEHLASVASMLDSSQLDHIEGRLSALSQKMESISEKKKELIKDEEKDKMILDLFNMVKNGENITKLLPKTIERLQSLEGLHNKALDLVKTLTQIEGAQFEVKGQVQNNKALLQGVQESFTSNLNEINNTIQNLDSRIKALKSK